MKLSERLNLPVSADLLERIDAYRASLRPLPSRAEAARMLIESKLAEVERQPTIPLVRMADHPPPETDDEEAPPALDPDALRTGMAARAASRRAAQDAMLSAMTREELLTLEADLDAGGAVTAAQRALGFTFDTLRAAVAVVINNGATAVNDEPLDF